MTLLAVFSALVATTTLQADSASPAQHMHHCDNSLVNINPVAKSFGWVDSIYGVAQRLCKNIQAETSDDYLQALSDIYEDITNGNFEVHPFISIAKQQVGLIISLVICAIILVGLPISGIIFCSCRSCGACGAKRKHRPSKCALSSYLLILTVGTALIAVSMAVYTIAAQNTADNIEDLFGITTNISEDLGNVITSASNNINCEVNETTGVFFDDVSATISKIPNETFDSFENHYGYHEMKSILIENGNMSKNFSYASIAVSIAASNLAALIGTPWSSREEVKRISTEVKVLNASLSEVSKYFTDVYSQLNTTFDDVDKKINEAKAKVEKSITSAKNSLSQAQHDIEGLSSTINTTANEIKTQIDNLTDSLKDIQNTVNTSPIKNGAIHGIKILVLVPCALVAIPALIALICGLARLPMNDSRPSRRPFVCHFGGCLAMTGVFCGFMFGWIVVLVASLSFIGGYGTEMVCKPLFDDPLMRVFNYIPVFNFTVPHIYSNESTDVGFGEVLMKCNEHSSLFAALNGNDIMDVSAIVDQADLEHYKQQAIDEFRKHNLNYTLNADDTISLKNSTSILQEAMSKIETELPDTMAAAGNNADRVAEVEKTQKSLREAKSLVNNLIGLVNKTVSDVEAVIEIASKSGSFADEGARIITQVFDKTITNVTQTLYDSKERLLNETFDCYPLYEVWQAIGVMVCDVFGKPVQGMWASAGLATILIIVLIIGLVLTAKYLQRMDPKYDRCVAGPERYLRNDSYERMRRWVEGASAKVWSTIPARKWARTPEDLEVRRSGYGNRYD
ncbi:Prominin-1 [Toxocara canis]|uniref:Prominin-1 n=1 Tax=Toxocara canis TaxID=6265 RepID=A0A0B2W1M0_TOXCA|nr:Prominin-1 [Toxocara canis]